MTSSTNIKALIEKNNSKKGKHNDKIIPVILAAISAVSILTTLGILITLLLETITFFYKNSNYRVFIFNDMEPYRL